MELPIRMWYKGFYIIGTGAGIHASGKFHTTDGYTIEVNIREKMHEKVLASVMQFIDRASEHILTMGFREIEDA